MPRSCSSFDKLDNDRLFELLTDAFRALQDVLQPLGHRCQVTGELAYFILCRDQIFRCKKVYANVQFKDDTHTVESVQALVPTLDSRFHLRGKAVWYRHPTIRLQCHVILNPRLVGVGKQLRSIMRYIPPYELDFDGLLVPPFPQLLVRKLVEWKNDAAIIHKNGRKSDAQKHRQALMAFIPAFESHPRYEDFRKCDVDVMNRSKGLQQLIRKFIDANPGASGLFSRLLAPVDMEGDEDEDESFEAVVAEAKQKEFMNSPEIQGAGRAISVLANAGYKAVLSGNLACLLHGVRGKPRQMIELMVLASANVTSADLAKLLCEGDPHHFERQGKANLFYRPSPEKAISSRVSIFTSTSFPGFEEEKHAETISGLPVAYAPFVLLHTLHEWATQKPHPRGNVEDITGLMCLPFKRELQWRLPNKPSLIIFTSGIYGPRFKRAIARMVRYFCHEEPSLEPKWRSLGFDTTYEGLKSPRHRSRRRRVAQIAEVDDVPMDL